MTRIEGNMWQTPGPWMGLTIGTAAPIFALASAGAISPGATAGLAIVPALFALQLYRTVRNPVKPEVYGSAAGRSYNSRMLAASLAYVAGLMIAVCVYNNLAPSPAFSAVIALLPSVPALAMVWAMARYLLDETDEYLRHRASLSAIIGLGAVLVVGTLWGFLETFGAVPHVWAWWVVPVFAIGLGIGQAVIAKKDNGQGDDE